MTFDQEANLRRILNSPTYLRAEDDRAFITHSHLFPGRQMAVEERDELHLLARVAGSGTGSGTGSGSGSGAGATSSSGLDCEPLSSFSDSSEFEAPSGGAGAVVFAPSSGTSATTL